LRFPTVPPISPLARGRYRLQRDRRCLLASNQGPGSASTPHGS
jgi:hypothetical protein